ncbi:MAG: hypothetical protein QME52_07775 [Bacteroidota bacterium]|nr:hypothetical protein [Bacteroidota bacterium]
MINSFKYRSVAILLAGIFSVFNIGLPVVLHYCKMMGTVSSNSCSMCDTDKKDSSNIQISKAESPCCKTIIAAERNKTEFLQTQNDDVTKLHLPKANSIIPIIHTFPSIDFQYTSKIFLTNAHSPPFIEDIPIFTSSLLI